MCPQCGGDVYRELGLLSVLAFFLPVHLLSPTKHRCAQCGASYTAGLTFSACLLNALFGLAVFLMGKGWPLSVIWLVVWLPVAYYLRTKGRHAGPAHTIVAGLFLGAFWSFALVISVPWFSNAVAKFSGVFVLVLVFMAGLATGVLALYLDASFPPRLVPM